MKLVKDDDPKAITLAIGDGANDVSMIMEAHIGVGLYGNEGMRAVQSSDYALGEFQFLWRLLFIHGRWSYLRNSELILYFFYKNIVFTMPQMYFAFINGYSGLTIFDDWYLTFYNMFFTAFPLMIKALFEYDINPHPKVDGEVYNKYMPRLYNTEKIFTVRAFVYWSIQGLYHSLLVYLFPMFHYTDGSELRNFFNNDFQTFSITTFTSVIFVVTIKLCIYERLFNAFNFISISLLSILFYIAYVWASNYTGFAAEYLSVPVLFSSGDYYLVVFFITGFAFIPDVMAQAWRFNINKTPTDILRLCANRKIDPSQYDKEFQRLYEG